MATGPATPRVAAQVRREGGNRTGINQGAEEVRAIRRAVKYSRWKSRTGEEHLGRGRFCTVEAGDGRTVSDGAVVRTRQGTIRIAMPGEKS